MSEKFRRLRTIHRWGADSQSGSGQSENKSPTVAAKQLRVRVPSKCDEPCLITVLASYLSIPPILKSMTDVKYDSSITLYLMK